jgi:putative cardiolipin synthase
MACAKLPTDYPRTESHALRDTSDTRLGRELVPLTEAQPGRSGIYPLSRGLDAFLARIVLADAADRSLDVQYYIWHGDTTGRLLLERVLRAAERGVRVRLLLDDLGTAADDEALLAIDAHENVEVRLFNPVALRSARGLGTAADFGRVNRRMHNKSFTADDQAAILGGRNVGDEYFEARPDLDFSDMDVMAVGPVVGEIASSFDRFWNSAAAIPIAAFGGRAPSGEGFARARDRLQAFTASAEASPYAEGLLRSQLAEQLRKGKLPFFWGSASLVYDDPAKAGTDAAEDVVRLLPQLKPLFDGVESEVLVVSPYFVPGKEGVAFFQALRERGVQVSVMTNSLASSDVSAVHAGYAKYREALLKAGVNLYEATPLADIRGKRKADKKQTGGVGGSSRASLHAKVFVIDRRAVFVGSLNLDPRSVDINTEIGVVFDSPEFGTLMADGVVQTMEAYCYRLSLDDDGDIVWTGQEAGQETRYTSEPHAGMWRRFSAWFLSLLPIEGQL